jgi:hypothetical protein
MTLSGEAGSVRLPHCSAERPATSRFDIAAKVIERGTGLG